MKECGPCSPKELQGPSYFDHIFIFFIFALIILSTENSVSAFIIDIMFFVNLA